MRIGAKLCNNNNPLREQGYSRCMNLGLTLEKSFISCFSTSSKLKNYLIKNFG
jgi:hypothetical protein